MATPSSSGVSLSSLACLSAVETKQQHDQLAEDMNDPSIVEHVGLVLTAFEKGSGVIVTRSPKEVLTRWRHAFKFENINWVHILGFIFQKRMIIGSPSIVAPHPPLVDTPSVPDRTEWTVEVEVDGSPQFLRFTSPILGMAIKDAMAYSRKVEKCLKCRLYSVDPHNNYRVCINCTTQELIAVPAGTRKRPYEFVCGLCWDEHLPFDTAQVRQPTAPPAFTVTPPPLTARPLCKKSRRSFPLLAAWPRLAAVADYEVRHGL
jgi:hypothetical protein